MQDPWIGRLALEHIVLKKQKKIKYDTNVKTYHVKDTGRILYLNMLRICPLIISLYEQLEDLYMFFVTSTKRKSVIVKTIAAAQNALQLRNLSRTRWAARAASIQAVWVSYESTMESLQSLKEMADDSKIVTDTDSILRKILQFDLVAFLISMKNVMWKTKSLTEHLQEEKLNIIDALTVIKGSIISL